MMDEKEKFGVWCTRYGSSIFGAAETWAKRNGVRIEFDTMDEARALADQWSARSTPNVAYQARRID